MPNLIELDYFAPKVVDKNARTRVGAMAAVVVAPLLILSFSAYWWWSFFLPDGPWKMVSSETKLYGNQIMDLSLACDASDGCYFRLPAGGATTCSQATYSHESPSAGVTDRCEINGGGSSDLSAITGGEHISTPDQSAGGDPVVDPAGGHEPQHGSDPQAQHGDEHEPDHEPENGGAEDEAPAAEHGGEPEHDGHATVPPGDEPPPPHDATPPEHPEHEPNEDHVAGGGAGLCVGGAGCEAHTDPGACGGAPSNDGSPCAWDANARRRLAGDQVPVPAGDEVQAVSCAAVSCGATLAKAEGVCAFITPDPIDALTVAWHKSGLAGGSNFGVRLNTDYKDAIDGKIRRKSIMLHRGLTLLSLIVRHDPRMQWEDESRRGETTVYEWSTTPTDLVGEIGDSNICAERLTADFGTDQEGKPNGYQVKLQPFPMYTVETTTYPGEFPYVVFLFLSAVGGMAGVIWAALDVVQGGIGAVCARVKRTPVEAQRAACSADKDADGPVLCNGADRL